MAILCHPLQQSTGRTKHRPASVLSRGHTLLYPIYADGHNPDMTTCISSKVLGYKAKSYSVSAKRILQREFDVTFKVYVKLRPCTPLALCAHSTLSIRQWYTPAHVVASPRIPTRKAAPSLLTLKLINDTHLIFVCVRQIFVSGFVYFPLGCPITMPLYYTCALLQCLYTIRVPYYNAFILYVCARVCACVSQVSRGKSKPVLGLYRGWGLCQRLCDGQQAAAAWATSWADCVRRRHHRSVAHSNSRVGCRRCRKRGSVVGIQNIQRHFLARPNYYFARKVRRSL